MGTAQANSFNSYFCAVVEHVLAHQKARFGLFICAVGIDQDDAKLRLAHLA